MPIKVGTYLLFTILISLGLSELSQAQLAGYQYRKKLTVDETQVSGATNLTNFPVLISLTDADFATIANSGFVNSSNGFDIAFTSSDGSTQLDHELIEYIAGTGELEAWVHFTTLSATSDTDFFIYFGNSSITTSQSTPSTWSSDFLGVYHLDSNSNSAIENNNCTNNGITFSTIAQIASSADYDNANDNIDCGTLPSLRPTDAITVSAWVQSKDANEDQWSAIGGISSNTSWADGYGMFFNSNTEVQFYVGNYTANVATGTIDPDVWNYVVGTYDRTAGGTDEVKIYVNGVVGTTDDYSTAINYNGGSMTIGQLGGWTTDWLNGYIDEFRLANVARSSDWISTEYNNQLSPSTFYSQIAEPPVLSNIESASLSATAGGAAIPITDLITLTTPFVDSVESATIEITNNLDSSEDVLAFLNTSLISGIYTSGTGTLALTGRASLADYQTALRNVTYQNIDGSDPTQTTRTISFTVEGVFANSSNIVTRNLEVTTVVTDLTSDFSNVVFSFDAQDADGDGNSLTNQPANGALANWIDISGNVTASSPGGDEPTLNSDFLGERGGILFDYNSGNNGDHYPLSEPTVAPTINSGTFQQKSFATVFRTTDNLSGLQVIYEQGGASKGYLIAIKDAIAYAYVFSNVWSTQDKSINLGTVEPNTSYIIIASHSSSGTDATSYWRASINGGTIQELTGATDMGTHGGDPNIGEEDGIRDPVTFANPGNTNNFDGYIGEITSWNTSFTSGQFASIYDYLCDKWCNTAPVISSIEGTNIDYLEGDGLVNITSTLSITDSDNTVMDSALVNISSNFESAEDILAFVDANGISGSWNSTSGELLLTGNATIANYETALRSITYENIGSPPTYSLRQIDILVYDWDDESNTLSRNINVINIPTLADIEGTILDYDEGEGAVPITSSITTGDPGSSDFDGATIQITNNYISGEDILNFVDVGGITSAWNDITGTLTLSGTATIAQYETALRAVTFENISSDPVELPRTVSFSTISGSLTSNTQSRIINVNAINSPPILSNLELTELIYPQDVINITNTIEVSDPDNTTIDSARVLITGNFQSTEDSLFYSPLFGITGDYDETTGILALSGNASFTDYQTALRSIEYFNYSPIPTGPERVISFLAYDIDKAESDTLKRTLEVSSVESISDLKVWLRADTGVITSGTEVVTWEDQSGNNNDYLGVNGSGTRPTFSASILELGGEPAINFAGNGDSFTDTDGPINYLDGMDEFTLFIVYRSDDVTDNNRGLYIAETPTGDDKTLTIRYDSDGANTGGSFTNVVKTGILGNSPANQLESFSDIQSLNPQITSLHWESGVTYDLYVDGILNNPSASGTPPIGAIDASTSILGKGGKDEGNSSWDGLIAEFILYCKNLSEAERQSVEDYLAVKYSRSIRKITAASGGESIPADNANATFTPLTGPVIQEGFPGELTSSGTIVLTAPSGYKWNTGAAPNVAEEAVYGGSTNIIASFSSFSGDSSTATFTITTASTGSNPGQLTFSGLEIRPNSGILPNTGFITNTGTTGQGGGTNYGTLTMVPGAIDSLIFIQQPTITNVDEIITPSIRVQLVDQFGNSVKSSNVNVSMALTSGTGSLTGTTPVATNSLGIADFNDLEINDIGSKEITASSTSLNSITSNSFEVVNAGVLTGFTIERVPSGNISSKTAGQTFNILVTAIDGTGNTITTFSGTVAVTSSCTIGTGNGTTASFSSGVLSSHALSITSVGNCTISVTNSAGSETGISNTFIVSPGAVSLTTSTISASPSTIQINGATSAITVSLKDVYGNNRTTSGGTVALSATDGTLGSVSDNSNGTYTATLTSSANTVISTVTGTLNSSPFTDNALVEFAEFTHIWTSQNGSPSEANDWDDIDNWDVNSIPNSNSVVLIPVDPKDGNEYPVIDVNNTTIQELTLETNAEITVSGSINFIVTDNISGEGEILGSNNGILTIGGNLDVSSITLGTVIFNGATEQTITSPNSFVNVEIDNPTTTNIVSDFSVSGTLTLTDGELLIPSGINLFANTQSYGSGTLRFQREITGPRGWRMISSPVASTYGDFLDGTLTQGFTGSTLGSAPLDSLQPNILTYLENYVGTDNQRYRTPTSGAQTLTEGQGIWAFFFGDITADARYNNPLPDTLDVNGQEFNGTGSEVEFGITFLAEDLENGGGGDGWNLIGNPFGASINWSDNSKWTKTDIDQTIYIWDPASNGGNGEFLTWNGTTGTLNNGLIAPFQGFWVKANSGSSSLKLKQTAKTTGANFLRKASDNDTVNPVIELTAGNGKLSKRTLISFHDNGSRQKDEFDGLRLIPFSDTHIEFYSLLNNGTQLEINNQPSNFENRVDIPLVLNGFEKGNALTGEFSIEWYINRNIPEDWKVLLIDLQNGNQINLKVESEYIIDHSTAAKLVKNSAPNSSDFIMKSKSTNMSTRFILRITTEEIEANIPETFYLNQNFPNPFNPSTIIQYGLTEAGPVSLTVYDILGRKIQTLVNSTLFEGNYSFTFDASDLASGVYMYQLVTNQGIETKKFTLIK